MRAYRTLRFGQHPDVADIQADGRKSSVGGKNYLRNTKRKAATRRTLKRRDKANQKKEVQ